MSGREEILGRIRANAARTADPRKAREAVAKRIKRHPRGAVPGGPTDAEGKIRRFADKAVAAAASVDIVAAGEEAKAIIAWLRSHNLPQTLRLGSDARLKRITWPKRGGPELLKGRSDGNDLTGLSHAFAGISETGTLIMASGPQNPSTLNMLPENHIVVVDAAEIGSSHEEVWDRIRKKYGAGNMPRTVNMITGPSRSADIEQTLILGAHGPVRLHIVVVKDAEKKQAKPRRRATAKPPRG